MERFNEVRTHIDDMHSYCSMYRGNSIGRVIHYVTVVCGLSIGEHVQVGEGRIIRGGVLIARYDFDRGYPNIKYEDANFNKIQADMIAGPEGDLKRLLDKKTALKQDLYEITTAIDVGWQRFAENCGHRGSQLQWGKGVAIPYPFCQLEPVECDVDICPIVHGEDIV